MARQNESAKEKLYKIYVTDSLKAIGGIDIRYMDLIDIKPNDGRSAEEVITEIKAHLSQL